MKVSVDIKRMVVNVSLSRRNLLDLLETLEGHNPSSATLVRTQRDSGVTLYVTAQFDADHYKDRDAAGPGINYLSLKPVSEME